MATLLQQLVNALSVSSAYVLIGLGITIIFGLSRVIAFAHAQFMVLGAFLAYSLVEAGLPYPVAGLLLAPLLVGVAGVATDRAIFRRNLDMPINNFITALGLVVVMQAVFVEVWGVEQQFQVRTGLQGGVWDVVGVRIGHERVLLFAVTVVAVLTVLYLLGRTDLGRSMRAVAEDRDAAALVGVNVSGAISSAFFIGSVLAGLAGALQFSAFPFTAYSGGALIIKALAVALVGGLGSVEGAVVVGLSLGIVETLGTAYGVPGEQWRDGYAFLLMIGILLWRPRGLFRGVGLR